MCWPHGRSEWAPVLDRVEPSFLAMLEAISRDERVVLILPPNTRDLPETMKKASLAMDNIRCIRLETNDTWTRDYGPITIEENGSPVILDFDFNGWGNKYKFDLDNAVTAQLHRLGLWGGCARQVPGIILEGGSIESDGMGTILTTRRCLSSPQRNAALTMVELEAKLKEWLGAKRILWLEHGELEGDDTDAHVDTLVRFASTDTILYVACDDPTDSHYESFKKMEEDIRRWRMLDGRPYRLYPLPWPKARYDAKGQRLPATYANFLITNTSVFQPVYGDPNDTQAMEIMRTVFPRRRIVPVDSSVFILQHGAVHCLTMQFPKGVLP